MGVEQDKKRLEKVRGRRAEISRQTAGLRRKESSERETAAKHMDLANGHAKDAVKLEREDGTLAREEQKLQNRIDKART